MGDRARRARLEDRAAVARRRGQPAAVPETQLEESLGQRRGKPGAQRLGCRHPKPGSAYKLRRMRMRAAVLEEFGQPLVVQELDLEEPKAGEVLVRLVARGVCHTDMYTASGVDPSGYAPTGFGHEGAGVIEAVGEGVRSLEVGDHVVTLFSHSCECVHCSSPKTNICLAIRDQQGRGYLADETTRLSRDGEPIRHFMGTSTFAEYTVMPEIALAKVSPEAPPPDRACLFACGLSTGHGAAMYTAKVEAGSTVVVFGAGMVGLGAVAGARLQNAARIVCVDLSEERLAMATHQGATETLVGGPDTVASSGSTRPPPAASARTTRSRRPASSPSCARRSSRCGRACLAYESRPAWRAKEKRSTSSRAISSPACARRLVVRRRQGPRPGPVVPAQRHLDGAIDVVAFLWHHITLDEVNNGLRSHERAGRHPQRVIGGLRLPAAASRTLGSPAQVLAVRERIAGGIAAARLRVGRSPRLRSVIAVPPPAASCQVMRRSSPIRARRSVRCRECVIDDDERRARLARRHGVVAAQRFTDVVAAVGALGGVHGTDPATVYLAARARRAAPGRGLEPACTRSTRSSEPSACGARCSSCRSISS